MGIYYKLTDQDMQTRNEFQWELNKEFEIDKQDQNPNADLCTPAWFHVYNNPILAILLNPIHADVINPRLFECECTGYCKLDGGMKVGFTKVKLIKEIEIPKITTEQKIAFGILCAKKVFFEKEWVTWADDWLNNKNRSCDNISMPIRFVASEDYQAAHSATRAADYFASITLCANNYIERVITYVIEHIDGDVACAADYAVEYATYADININLVELVQEALKY